MNALLGIFLHAIGGLASGSFYVPFRRVKNWAWESYWLVNGFFAWLIVPWLVALLTIPDFLHVLKSGDNEAIFWCYIFGILWGIGGFTFGLTMRYLGLSLGMAVALGLCAAFGTIIPPLYSGTFGELFRSASGIVIFSGVIVCLTGIAVCGWAGADKDREMDEQKKKETVKEFNLRKGLAMAVVCGILSACFAFGVEAGKPVADLAQKSGADPLWKTGISYLPILAGGFTLNLLACVFMHFKNRSSRNYVDIKTPLLNNYFFSALAGIVWYQQFMFYGMGTSFLEGFEFASWTLHMAFIIVFSTMWGLHFREWRGVSRMTKEKLYAGLAVIIISTAMIGLGKYLEK